MEYPLRRYQYSTIDINDIFMNKFKDVEIAEVSTEPKPGKVKLGLFEEVADYGESDAIV